MMKLIVSYLIVLGLVAMPLIGFSKVTLDKGASGEAIWWGDDPDEEFPCICSGDAISVELATYFDGDWAVVLLDTAKRFTVENITSLSFSYRHIVYDQGSGPRMVVLLEKETSGGYVQYYLVISDEAPENTGRDCIEFTPTEWWYAKWNGVDFSSYQGDSGTSFSGPSVSGWGVPSDIQGAKVVAVGVLMGVVDTVGDGTYMGGADVIKPGKAIVDCVTLTWLIDTTEYGGTYDLEKPWPDPEDFESDTTWNKWQATGLWGRVSQDELFGEDASVTAFPSPTHAAYFGNVDPNTGTGSYDKTGTIAYGTLKSPPNILNPGDKFITISFKYYREVEQYVGAYPSQVYDKTYVQIKFNGNAWTNDDAWNNDPWGTDDQTEGWKTIWYKDSSDPNSTSWEEVTISYYPGADGEPDPSLPIVVPPDATKMWIRFVFDSVDGWANDFLGWLIDDVRKQHTPEPSELVIITDTLPQATEKEPYVKGDLNNNSDLDPGEWIDSNSNCKVDRGEFIDANGNGRFDPDEVYFQLEANSPNVRWELVPGRTKFETLPPRLQLDSGTGRIYGHVELGASGTYEVTIKAISGRQEVTKTFYLAVRPPVCRNIATNVIAEETFDPPSGGLGWVFNGLWHQTDEVWIDNESSDIVTPDYGEVAYFGQNDPVDGVDPNYNAGGRVKGCLVSPWYPIKSEFVGEQLIIGFKSWREVESYDGAFDKTWVDIRFEGGEWKTIWYKDSSMPSERMWTWEEIETGIFIPKPLPKVQIRFCFDSVDGYNNDLVGWLVDEITLYAGSVALTIANQCPLPEASVGAFYQVELRSSGGQEGRRRWRIEGDLPPGLALREDPTGTWYIEGIPRETGTFAFTLVVEIVDSGGTVLEVASKPCSITVTEQTVLLYEDFETDPAWEFGGLWHITGDNGVGVGASAVPGLGAANHAAYYGKDDDTANPNYDTGQRTTGAMTLVSPLIDLSGVEAIKVTFDYYRWVEYFENGDFDITLVQVKFDTDNVWYEIWRKSSKDASQKMWITEELPAFLVPSGATKMWIRFVFDSVDKWFNKFTGWLVDNIKIEKAPAAGAQPLSTLALKVAATAPRDLNSLIAVQNVPNPVRDVHTTVFMVRGIEAERIRVEVYDLSGRLVWQAEAPGNELVWHTEDLSGLPLANGVYLYRAYVKVGNTWVVTGVQKVVILR